MSWVATKLFGWLQRAPFYYDVHAEAVECVGPGGGRTWLDVGCGPGLVAALAERNGYRASGVDRDPDMIRAARRLHGDRCEFFVADVAQLGELPRFDVVSAASLLILLPDARVGLATLWHQLVPGGTLLIVETSPEMTPARAREVASQVPGGRHPGLALWARARSGRAVSGALFDTITSASRERRALLHGLVDAWIFTKRSTP